MGKMNELSMLLDELIDCGRKLTQTAQALRKYYSDTSPEPDWKNPGAELPPEPEKNPTHEKKEKASYTKEDVRALLSAKAGEEHGIYRDQVKALVKKYGNGGSLTNISADDYPELVQELQEIGNA